jgi:hypothetical protein
MMSQKKGGSMTVVKRPGREETRKRTASVVKAKARAEAAKAAKSDQSYLIRVMVTNYTGASRQPIIRGRKLGPPGGWDVHITREESLLFVGDVEAALEARGIELQKKRIPGALAWKQPSSKGMWVYAIDGVATRAAFKDLGLAERKAQKPGTPRIWK